jgi:hypothetical protein
MRNRQTRPQHGAMATVEEKKLLGEPVTQAAHEAALDVLTCPCGAKPLAFEAQERDLIEWIDRPQARIEFEAVDDPHGIAEPDVLGTQVAVSVDDAALANARRERRCSKEEKPSLDASDPPGEARRQAEAWIKKHAPVIR